MKWKNWAFKAIILGIVFGVEAHALESKAISIKVNAGTVSGTVQAIGNKDDYQILSLYSNRKGNLNVDFKYSAAGLSSSLVVKGALRQYTASNKFTLKVQNASGAYVDVGVITGSSSMRVISMSLPSGIVLNGSISLRLIGSGVDDIDIDQLIIADSVSSPPPQETVPVISNFSASPSTISVGQNSTLSFSVAGASSLILNPGNINVTGQTQRVVNPSVATTYTLTATNSAGSATKSISVSVSEVAPPPPTTGAAIIPGTTWYWQLQGSINMSVQAKVYDIDLYDTNVATISSLKQSGRMVICYFSAGTYEDWRSDANLFPSASFGNNVDGWAGEKWIDVRNQAVRDIMTKRMDLAKSKGCDGLEPDNVDGYSNNPGFPLTAQDQINFNSFLADQAHARGMIIALKNSTDLVTALVNKFDFAVVEECFKYNECEAYSPFIAQGKAVLNAEYSSYSSTICTRASSLKFSTVFFNLALNGSVYRPCP